MSTVTLMFLVILTALVCLTKAEVYLDNEDSTPKQNYENENLYNVYEYVNNLHLQRCALVAIGLKYFSIFVESAVLDKNNRIRSSKFFLGMCHQTTLEKWKFCSPQLEKKRPHKCKFYPKNGKYHGRVHRRYCDFGIMSRNPDCQCITTIFGETMYKVIGFPACYIPPLPDTLCRYNPCGLERCQPSVVENAVFSVECDPKCNGGNPFCEYPMDKSAALPRVSSNWSDWEPLVTQEGTMDQRQKLYQSICTNRRTCHGDVDCLGPGTACCPKSIQNCTCDVYQENGTVKAELVIYSEQRNHTSGKRHSFTESSLDIDLVHERSIEEYQKRHIRETKDVAEDIADDDEDIDEESDDDDIVMEENTEFEDFTTVPNEQLEKDETVTSKSNANRSAVFEEFKAAESTTTVTTKKSRGGANHIRPFRCICYICIYLVYSAMK